MSPIMASLRAEMAELLAAGAIDKVTMRTFDGLRPPPVREFDAADIKQLRKTLALSRTLFARHLLTTASTVRRWELGETRPAGPALKLLNLIANKGLQAIL